jgi:hypothetical protein
MKKTKQNVRKRQPAQLPPPASLRQVLMGDLRRCRAKLEQLDVQACARQSGFLKRRPRKIPLVDFLIALLALSAESVLSLERIAALISLTAKVSYSKQALHKRIGPAIERFLAQTVIALMADLAQTHTPDCFRHFQRVLVQDSTVESVPRHLAKDFPGSRNQKKCDRAALKIQFIGDLLNATVLHWSLSGFTRNDQTAAHDVLAVARPGDLIIRDLGYYVLRVFFFLQLQGVYFLSRFRHGVNLYDLAGQRLDLVGELKQVGALDRPVYLGEERVLVRLVAFPVPEALANSRRRKARANHDGRYQPAAAHLTLLGWNIFITNVPTTVWLPQTLAAVYRLRWRIEIVFKAWKSHLGLRQLNTRTGALLRLAAAIKLLFCVLAYRQCQALELLSTDGRHVSLLRLARILEQCACLMASALLNISSDALLEHHLAKHLFYDRRRDRQNFYELLTSAGTS